MQVVTTEFVGRTEKKPAKIVARSGISKVSVSWDSSLGIAENHQAAVRKLCMELGRIHKYVGGATADGFAWVAVVPEALCVDMHDALAAELAPAPEPVPAPAEVKAIPHAVEAQSVPVEGSTALPEPVAEPAKPARVRRAA